MKKILLISDTHSYIDERIIHYAKNVDQVWHAGDIGDINVMDSLKEVSNVKAVHGNIDNNIIRKEYSENLRFKCEEVDVWITHIGGYPGRYSKKIKNIINDNPPDLFVCGHSHILKVINDKKLNLLHINPGAIGKQGFHKVRTMVKFEISKKEINNLEIIEFKK